MSHVVLLGDSIFDNAAYVAGGPAVITQVRERLPQGWRATLNALDGSITQDVPRQLQSIPPDASHLFVSVGGNDALGHMGFLSEEARSVAEVLHRLADIGQAFEYQYHHMVQAVLRYGLPAALCTIYYPRLPDPDLQRVAVTGLTLFNDCIIRAAFSAGLPLLDLRLICTEETDFANPIEPSTAGGAKIAEAISEAATHHDFNRRQTVVFR